jgi:hypothetical protein
MKHFAAVLIPPADHYFSGVELPTNLQERQEREDTREVRERQKRGEARERQERSEMDPKKERQRLVSLLRGSCYYKNHLTPYK